MLVSRARHVAGLSSPARPRLSTGCAFCFRRLIQTRSRILVELPGRPRSVRRTPLWLVFAGGSEYRPAVASAGCSPTATGGPRHKYRAAEPTRRQPATTTPAVWFELAGCCEIAPTG